MTLNFDQPYSLYYSNDTETPSYNLPEPSSGPLLILGAALLVAQTCFRDCSGLIVTPVDHRPR